MIKKVVPGGFCSMVKRLSVFKKKISTELNEGHYFDSRIICISFLSLSGVISDSQIKMIQKSSLWWFLLDSQTHFSFQTTFPEN